LANAYSEIVMPITSCRKGQRILTRNDSPTRNETMNTSTSPMRRCARKSTNAAA